MQVRENINLTEHLIYSQHNAYLIIWMISPIIANATVEDLLRKYSNRNVKILNS